MIRRRRADHHAGWNRRRCSPGRAAGTELENIAHEERDESVLVTQTDLVIRSGAVHLERLGGAGASDACCIRSCSADMGVTVIEH